MNISIKFGFGVYLCGTANPLPTRTECGYVRNNAQHRLLAAEHGLGFDIAEPNLQVGRQIFAHQFQHGHITTTVQLETIRKHFSSLEIDFCLNKSEMKGRKMAVIEAIFVQWMARTGGGHLMVNYYVGKMERIVSRGKTFCRGNREMEENNNNSSEMK